MSRTKTFAHASRITVAVSVIGFLLAACGKGQSASTAPPLDALPLTTALAPSAPAPSTARLPSAPPARLARLAQPQDSYAYLDRAYAAANAYSDAPPDYTVNYDGERPWIWRASDNSERVVERTSEGLRYYYYEPGAGVPYLVQDGSYTYAYSDGMLVAIYGPGGEQEPYEYLQRRTDVAGRYLAWGATLYAASRSQQRFAAEQAHWDERRADIAATRAAWSAEQSRDDAWAAYHQAHAAEEQTHWAIEQERRNAEVVRYASTPPLDQRPFAAALPHEGSDEPAQTFNNHRFPMPEPGQPGAPPPRFAQEGAPSRPPYDPSTPQVAPGIAQAQRQSTLEQAHAQAEAQHEVAGQAHASQLATEQQQVQASRNAAEQQRRQAFQQNRASALVERQATEQAHAAQQQDAQAALAQQQTVIQHRRAADAAQATASQQQAARAAAEAQRQATLQQAHAAAQVQHQAADQAHAAQAAQMHAEAQAARQAQQGARTTLHEHARGPGDAPHPSPQP